MICATCLGVLQRREGLYQSIGTDHQCLHHRTVSDLKTAADSGCFMCKVFWHSFPTELQDQLLAEDEQTLSPSFIGEIPALDDDSDDAELARSNLRQLFFTEADISAGRRDESAPGSGDALRSYRLTVSAQIAPPWRGYNRPFDLDFAAIERLNARLKCSVPCSMRTDSVETWATVERWIHNCVHNHDRCSTRRTPLQYPSRLLQVKARSRRVRLVETSADRPEGDYMTLSHRWGGADILTLRSNNYQQLQQGIFTSDMPQAFQDTIRICKRLGVSYLWIDSLCIRQDDHDDWIREAALMQQVYSHSFINVSALGAKDSTCSFFNTRDPSSFCRPTIQALRDWTDPTAGLRHYTVHDRHMWRNEVTEAHLNSRGWVLQERLLATRVLHFGKRQVSWECREQALAEQYPTGIPSMMHMRGDIKAMDPGVYIKRCGQLQRASGCYTLSWQEAACRMWSDIVREYSACQLTKESDRLVALSGVAKEVAAMMGDEYVVGLWRAWLEYGLTWSRQKPPRGVSRPSVRRYLGVAPSWSWASVNGPVIYSAPADTGEALLRVVAEHLDFETRNSFGPIVGGSLSIAGSLCRLDLIDRASDRYTVGIHPMSGAGTSLWFEDLDIELDEDIEAFDPLNGMDLYCMPAFTRQRRNLPDHFRVDVLLLHPVHESCLQFMRFGMLQYLDACKPDLQAMTSYAFGNGNGASSMQDFGPDLITLV